MLSLNRYLPLLFIIFSVSLLSANMDFIAGSSGFQASEQLPNNFPEPFEPEAISKKFPSKFPIPANSLRDNSRDTAIAVVQNELGLGHDEVGFTSGYDTDIAEYAYLYQLHQNGIQIINTHANLGFVLRNGQKYLSTLNAAFIKVDAAVNLAKPEPTIQLPAAIEALHKAVVWFKASAKAQPILKYYAQSGQNISLVYVIPEEGNGHEAFVDAHSAEVVGGNNFVTDWKEKSLS
ncbi:hypothetical protein CPB83DRAFT_861928 [Crepidotus variabilis]|uniref:Uncharacterized protein n=1 Tax=Crepidotus variabilis TaxID=179855 RepID=A0A9P6E7P4_9AGAR|nr:hypothetical protein CPB83DRAFT_861928 [Crepidotus variabilis]